MNYLQDALCFQTTSRGIRGWARGCLGEMWPVAPGLNLALLRGVVRLLGAGTFHGQTQKSGWGCRAGLSRDGVVCQRSPQGLACPTQLSREPQRALSSPRPGSD